MKIIDWPAFCAGEALDLAGGRPAALTAGVFDGVHRGHQALIRRVLAKAPEMFPLVITFRQNPKAVLGSARWDGDILPLERRLEIFRETGLSALVLIDFSLEFSKMAGREFLAVLRDRARPGFIVVGRNFHCGWRMDTGAEGIRAFFAGSGVETEIHESVNFGGSPVSSSRIRRAIREGDLALAAELLGRPGELFPAAAGMALPEGASSIPAAPQTAPDGA